MRLRAILMAILLVGVATYSASGESRGTVVIHQHGERKVGSTAEDTVRTLGVELLKSSNFNTAAHAGILKQSVPAIHDRYRRVVAGDCLVITYDHPVAVRTVGGEVTAFEIIIGLGRPDYADALFTIDPDGRVVAHEKYSGRAALELRKAVGLPANAR